MSEFEAEYGVRAAGNQVLYDNLDAFFREGGQRAYVARYTAGGIAGALALFTETLGPGQVIAPQETPGATTYGLLLDHAAAFNRFAIMDVASNDTVAAMTTLGGAIPTQSEGYGMLVGPWVTIPAPAGVIGGSARTIAASPVVAALCVRADATGNPNRAAAGRDFPLQYVTGFVRAVTTAEVETLLNAGVNLLLSKYSVFQLYGFQTGIASTPDSPYWQANVGRFRMWLTAQSKSVGEGYMFKPIDGRGLLANALKKDLQGILLDAYNVNALYGLTPEDAFNVNVGAAVNTQATVAQGELRAVAEIRPSLHAKSIVIDLVTVPITGRVSQAA
jgi:hypothetical protein